MDRDQIISIIKTLSESGLKPQAIANRLTADGILTLTGKGKWHRGTVENILKRPQKRKKAVEQAVIPLDVPAVNTVKKSLYDKMLKECDRLNTEIKRINTELDARKSRILEFEKEISTNKQTRLDEPDIKAIIQAALDPVIQEMNSIKALISGITIEKPADKQPVNLNGWTVNRSPDEKWRAFRRLNGKTRAVYLGQEYNSITSTVKIQEAVRRKGADWGLTPEQIREMTGDDPATVREQIIDIIRKRGGDSRTAAIWKCVRDAEQAGIDRETFRGVIDSLAAEMAVQLSQGDLNQTPEAERDKLLWMDKTIRAPYCSIILTI